MNPNTNTLHETARALVAPGKGLLAADESFGTIEKRFQADNIPVNEDTRRAYRELLLGAPSAGQYLSGAILFDETLRQNTSAGQAFPLLLREQGIIPGIKVDAGAHDLALHPNEKITDGLDGLRERLAEYKQLGARFAKWRAVITIGDNIPSRYCLQANAHTLARYAALCQEADIVPIVEPETLMDGDHDLQACATATESALHFTFEALRDANVSLEGVLLKPNMILPGKNGAASTLDEVAQATVSVLMRVVPASVPGIVFLSGGQDDVAATQRLNAIVKLARTQNAPWQITFSFARALQDRAMKTWGGHVDRVPAARDAFLARLRQNALARDGAYAGE